MARPNVVSELRSLMPARPLSLADGQWVAERQAMRLLRLCGITEAPVPESVIAGLPRIRVRRANLKRSAGGCDWLGGYWLVLVKASDLPTRQRFSLAHEFKHILDHPWRDRLYPATDGMSSAQRAERICEFFAASLLMPRVWVRRAWTAGLQDVSVLAEVFDVSRSAMVIRLSQLGLVEPAQRCRAVAEAA